MALSMIDPALHKQLFLDDGAVAQMTDVTRVLHSPEKCGPVLRPDRSREQIALQSRSVPQWSSERGIWEWWYWGSYEVSPYGKYQSTSLSLMHYAVSEDGVRWETPSLGRYVAPGTRVGRANGEGYLVSHRT